METNYYTHISSKHNYFDLKLKEVWQYRDLIWMFTKRSFTVSYKQTILGPLWLFLNPLMTSIVYVVLFGQIARLGTDGVPQILFYLSSNAMWSYFSVCLSNNASTFTGNAYLFGKVYFPRLVMPISNVLSAIGRWAIQMFMTIVLLLYFLITGAVHPNWAACLLIPLILIQLGIMGMGLGVIISALTTKYRDLNVLVSFGLSLWMYATPVVYPLSTVSGWVRRIVLVNPVSAPIELYRYALLGVGHVNAISIIYSWVLTIIFALLGIIIFNKVERTFMDTV